MRVLYLINDLGGGGAQKVAMTAAGALLERGHDVAFVTLTDRRSYEPPFATVSLGRRKPGGWLGILLAGFRLRSWVNQKWAEPADIVISSLPWADKVAQAARLPNTWHWIHNTLSEQVRAGGARDPARKLTRLRQRYDSRNLVAVSEGVAVDLRDKLGCNAARIVTIYNPFDLAEIRSMAGVTAASIPEEPFILHVGRFAPQKRHDILLDAYKASAIKHKLVLLAEPRPELEALVVQRGLSNRVIIAGFQSNPFEWYARADALVLSSDFEGLGNVIIEALACGTPVVSTDCPWGPAEIMIGDLARYLSPVGDVQRLAALISEVTASRPRVDASVVDRFSVAHHVAAIERLAEKNATT